MSAATLLTVDGTGKITRAAVTPVRASTVEQALIGRVPTPEMLREACESCRAIEAIEDIHAPASYRQHLAAVLSRRALEKALTRIGRPVPAKLH